MKNDFKDKVEIELAPYLELYFNPESVQHGLQLAADATNLKSVSLQKEGVSDSNVVGRGNLIWTSSQMDANVNFWFSLLYKL